MVLRKRVLPTDRLHYKLLAAAYTVLLGLVLPFICWGTLATPGHPHRMAHLVFFMPPMYVEMQNEASKVDNKANLAGEHDSKLMGDHAQHAVKPDAPAAQPIGRSVPDELASAISILSPLFIVPVLLLFSPTLSIFRLSHRNTDHLFDPSIMTPPPRFVLLWAV
jgi:hypothetical protein